MVGVATLLESLVTLPPHVITLVANTAADVLPNRLNDGNQWTRRSIQNKTGGDLYIAEGTTADNVLNYHYVLADGLVYTAGSTNRVSAFSVGGGKVATLEQKRNNTNT